MVLRGALLLTIVWAGIAAEPPQIAARNWRVAHEKPILDEFFRLLELPNIARNLADMRRNADAIAAMFARRGVTLRPLEAAGAPPALYGEIAMPGATRTILFYVHYDGQPVEPRQWTVTQPFQPVLRDNRVWARSASDDKAPLIALAAALDALRAAEIPLKANIKFFFDGEEEAGSPHIADIVGRHKSLLNADVWLFCDGPVHQSRQQQIVFGVRGSTSLDVTVYGPVRELHSGHYGNWVPNPALMLSSLIASMKDDDTGRVLIKDFYADTEPLSAADKQALAQLPPIEASLQAEFGLARTEGEGRTLNELLNEPALNIQGITAAGTGAQARNVIPASATAAIGIRLVRGNHWQRMQDRVIAHIRSRGYHVVETDPDVETRRRYGRIAKIGRRAGYNAVRAPMDSEIARRVVGAIEAARGPILKVPTLGGSLPIAPITEILKAPVLIVPIANHDNNQHAHDENIRLENLWAGIEMMAALLALE